jgi:hypothetical protein
VIEWSGWFRKGQYFDSVFVAALTQNFSCLALNLKMKLLIKYEQQLRAWCVVMIRDLIVGTLHYFLFQVLYKRLDLGV